LVKTPKLQIMMIVRSEKHQPFQDFTDDEEPGFGTRDSPVYELATNDFLSIDRESLKMIFFFPTFMQHYLIF
jgi:hypothetical protein